MGKELESDKAQKLRTGYFQNLSINQNATQAGCAVGTAFNHAKGLEDEIQEHGLMPILNKYGLVEARDNAILGQSLIVHGTTAEECFLAIPIARKLAAGLISIENMETVIDQVFTHLPSGVHSGIWSGNGGIRKRTQAEREPNDRPATNGVFDAYSKLPKLR